MDKLKPCPFCGSSEVELFEMDEEDNPYRAWVVRCHKCDVQTAMFVGSIEQKKRCATNAWNRRVKGE
ncbi:restriction alleviation protein, Lar family [Limnobaculum zhutongyuii]|uniref:Restriction alleviation protein, Lar family n=1 Tax=Limnobaculum zhutongyuii TaxID=2498113 RepID=A0A411WIR2_9GAMM|nr:Lar family restriction alleviation protein [Limnobaculum zhutongyuii]QBH96075.1 restriction alleviation protein, Lar family [Limnobaculum zhutongyuii]TQS86142.1 restriction alleviation protein, Lar family [Limnobaculum zhutongyuii]